LNVGGAVAVEAREHQMELVAVAVVEPIPDRPFP